MNITMIGLDIAKNVFQVHGVNGHGKVVVRKNVSWGKVLEFFANLPACLKRPLRLAESQNAGLTCCAIRYFFTYYFKQWIAYHISSSFYSDPELPINLPRRFVVKCLAPALTQAPELLERFYQEAQNQAMLDHPAIVQATDYFENGGQFLVIKLN